jgi:acyl carrier protein
VSEVPVPADREQFYESFTAFLQTLAPKRGLPPPAPDTHLWEAGYLNSFALMEVVVYLEEVTGREIPLGPNMLSTFFTVRRIYDAHVDVSV